MTESTKPPSTPIGVGDFLESSPPGSVVAVSAVYTVSGSSTLLATPDIQIHCDSKNCGGTRFFTCVSVPRRISQEWQSGIVEYVCRNCRETKKTFALLFHTKNAGNNGELFKIGELPTFGPPIPARVISLIGPDRELFIKGRRAEDQGLGIGAFAYYRRVVENQWQRLTGEVIRVAERVGAPKSMVETLKKAAAETQFSKAVDLAKDAIPSVLRIDGHNPLTLLHQALSEGLHEKDEGHCLELAGSIRVLLTELADRLGQALKDGNEVKAAVSRLMNRDQGESTKPETPQA